MTPIIKARDLTKFGQFRLLPANDKFSGSLPNVTVLKMYYPRLHTTTVQLTRSAATVGTN